MIWLAGYFTISVALVFLGWLAMKSARIDWAILFTINFDNMDLSRPSTHVSEAFPCYFRRT
jgi:hypothetical protein